MNTTALIQSPNTTHPPFLGELFLDEDPLVVPTLPAPDFDDIELERVPTKQTPSKRGRRLSPWGLMGLFSVAMVSLFPHWAGGAETTTCAHMGLAGVSGGNKVHTSRGLETLGRVAPGDWLLSGNPNGTGLSYAQVSSICRRTTTGSIRVILGDEAGYLDELLLGSAQKIWAYGQGWLKVSALSAGDRVRTGGGEWVLVLGLEPVEEERTLVYVELSPPQALLIGLDGIFSR